ncbi:hypothetical protein WN944_029307 [Citrus x changshan-huyou]|uniref:Uncharacterized protein n=1 Tax=Citrus x changshan-huyou TaxID=2935761 RepID=A0AAP0Q9Q5_9ROSI
MMGSFLSRPLLYAAINSSSIVQRHVTVLLSTFNIFRGRLMLYNVLLRSYAAKHEKEIDLNLLKLRIKAREIGLLLWEKAAIYGQTRFFEILQYVSSHSASLSQSDQEFPVIKLSRNQEANGGCSGLQQQANNKSLVFVLCYYADGLYM